MWTSSAAWGPRSRWTARWPSSRGCPALTGAPVHACDLRAGAAMVIAGLAAQGTTEIDGVYHIERGYETLVEKLSGVGAKIQVLFLPDDEAQTQAG